MTANEQTMTDEQILDAAKGIRYRRYRETVDGVVEDLKRAIADGEVTDEGGAREWLVADARRNADTE
jgi:hypothetical protein